RRRAQARRLPLRSRLPVAPGDGGARTARVRALPRRLRRARRRARGQERSGAAVTTTRARGWHGAADGLATVGTAALWGARALAGAVRPSLRLRAVVYQLHVQGTRALGLAIAASVFVGMALAVQLGYGLARFGATAVLSQMTTLGLVRELLPVFSGLVI